MNEPVLSPKKKKQFSAVSVLAAVIGSVSILYSLWMRFSIRGTKPLLMEASAGKYYRSWNVFLVIGLILLIAGVIIYRILHHGSGKEAENPSDTVPEIPVSAETAAAVPTDNAAQEKPQSPVTISEKPKFCPACGKPIAEGNLFCQNCGTKLNV